ncbi:hypothetical protein QS257_02565 [Terrilactibacillus sp. S3-3]|nr:hypothetical protein QS257_02565 [Terrilactibacillus sp. S3-3]
MKFSWPTDSEKDNRHNLWVMVLPPLVMMIVMVVVAIVQPRGIYVIISVFMFVTTLVTSTYQYIRESKQLKTRRKERKTNYTNYLREKREVLHQLYEKQKFVLHYQFPGTATLKELTRQLSPRIWERSRADADFLEIRLGTATLPADYEIQGSEQELANRSFDELKRSKDHCRSLSSSAGDSLNHSAARWSFGGCWKTFDHPDGRSANDHAAGLFS